MDNVCYSSEVYNLAPEDLAVLKDTPAGHDCKAEDEAVILIGNSKLGTKDTLLKGREVVERAVAAKKPYIPVRIAFVSRINKYNLPALLVRQLRYKHIAYSSNHYHIDPKEIRKLGIERGFRNAKNAYMFSNPKYQMSEEERAKNYQNLKESMLTKGYDDNWPIDIMLCRQFGVQDNVNQGHHRMSVALECSLPQISIMFSAAGQAPKFLHPLFKMFAKISQIIKVMDSK